MYIHKYKYAHVCANKWVLKQMWQRRVQFVITKNIINVHTHTYVQTYLATLRTQLACGK